MSFDCFSTSQSTDEDLKVTEKKMKKAILNNLNKLPLPKEVLLSPQAENAFETLEQLLLDLEGSPVKAFLEDNINEPIKDYSQWKKNKIASKSEVIVILAGSDYPDVPLNAGVYVWVAGSKKWRYIGSTTNQYSRFISHVHDFTQDTDKKVPKMQAWVKKHNNLHSCKWQQVFDCPNFLLLFILANLHYQLNPKELWALKLATEMMPRILEQMLLDHYSFHWNIQKTVNYSFNTYKKILPYYSLIEAKTGLPIRNFYCITEARIVLGVKDIFILKVLLYTHQIIPFLCY